VDYLAPGKRAETAIRKILHLPGREAIEAKENWNYSNPSSSITRSFTHTGFMAEYKFSKAFTASLYLVTGGM